MALIITRINELDTKIETSLKGSAVLVQVLSILKSRKLNFYINIL